jgi:hypothetical protein
MLKFEPDIGITPLNKATPGTLVIFDGIPGFAGTNQNVQIPNPPVVLAAYEAAAARFVYRYFDTVPTVIIQKQDVIIRPNLTSLVRSADSNLASSRLYLYDQPYINVVLPNNDLRLLGLHNGNLVSPTVGAMDAFASWEAGVVSLGQFVPILKVVGPSPPLQISNQALNHP